jgi:hypothetical protein
MIRTTRTQRALAALTLLLACTPAAQQAPAAQPGRYLFAWGYHVGAHDEHTSFLTVIDADSASPTYATIVATLPTGIAGGMPHHTEMMMPPNGWPLFASAFGGSTALFDLSNPLTPRITGVADSVPGFAMPHSHYRLADGRVLATLQFSTDSLPGKAGGLALFSADGKFLRSASSTDSTFPGAAIRTYSGDVSETADRVITTSSPMDDERTADVMQLWRLSDLKLLRTIAMPEVPTDSMWHYPFEVRFIRGGKEALMNTYYCAFYHLTGLDGPSPVITRVHTLEFPKNTGCGVPLLIGHWWIMPVQSSHQYLVFDITDPQHPRQVQAFATDTSFAPHWSARDLGSNRIVLPTEAPADARILIARFDSTTGRLSWDESFRDPVTGRLGVSLNRTTWPHGATTPAAPHGVIFGR